MNFADSLNENEIKKRQMEEKQERHKNYIEGFVSHFEDYIKCNCTVIAQRGGKNFSGYLAYDSDEFGMCLVIHDFPGKEVYNSRNWICGLGIDKKYADDLCDKMISVIQNLGFKQFSIKPKWIMLQKVEYYKPMFSDCEKSRIVNDHEEYAIYIDIRW